MKFDIVPMHKNISSYRLDYNRGFYSEVLHKNLNESAASLGPNSRLLARRHKVKDYKRILKLDESMILPLSHRNSQKYLPEGYYSTQRQEIS